MISFDPRQVDARAVRLCVVGAGTALIATGLPWQEWPVSCFVRCNFGPPLLATWTGGSLAAMALAVLLCSAMPATDARGLLRRARVRAVVAGVAAVLWVAPLPLGPEVPPDVLVRVDWTVGCRAGAVGASVAAIGAAWWSRALASLALDRGRRRAFARRDRRAVTSVRCAP